MEAQIVVVISRYFKRTKYQLTWTRLPHKYLIANIQDTLKIPTPKMRMKLNLLGVFPFDFKRLSFSFALVFHFHIMSYVSFVLFVTDLS
jgi:hypothetical protein